MGNNHTNTRYTTIDSIQRLLFLMLLDGMKTPGRRTNDGSPHHGEISNQCQNTWFVLYHPCTLDLAKSSFFLISKYFLNWRILRMWSLTCCMVCLQALEYVRCDCGICRRLCIWDVSGFYIRCTLRHANDNILQPFSLHILFTAIRKADWNDKIY